LIHQEKIKGHWFATTTEDQDDMGISLYSSHEEEEEEEHDPSFKKIEREQQQRVT